MVGEQSLLERLANARKNTDELFHIVRNEALYDRPIPERHRIVFYLGHLEAFDWNLFRTSTAALKSFDPDFDRLFAFGIDPVDGGLPTDQPSDWPSVQKVLEYTSRLRRTIDEAIDAGKLADAEDGQHTADQPLNVAIEHRLMHAETLAYMFHRLPFEKKHVQPQMNAVGTLLANDLVEIPRGETHLGLSRADHGRFGWDNEYEGFDTFVESFRIDKYMVSNGEFLRFVLDGGYDNATFWSPADWQWKEQQAVRNPVFWQKLAGDWFYRGMFETIPLPLAWPVYVSHAEASAYARWAGKQLPTESAWQRAAYGTNNGPDREYPWGDEGPLAGQGNFDFANWDPVDVNAFPQNQSAFGVVGQLGNGWEWTSTEFGPFPGFEPFSFYPGYSANFFDGEHFVIKGGSSRTAACMLRRSFRNWFQPHYQYVYAGFRCVSAI